MRLKTRRDIVVFSGSITAAACAVVASTIMLLYPVEMWRWELTLSLSLTIGLCGPITTYVGLKLQENQRLTEELQRLVNRDRLTDAATRDFFFDRMAEMPEAYGVSLMVDIDHFKRINDTYGHLAGDQVIARVAQALRGCVRREDIVCRFGGEEFVIFLHGRDRADGLAAAERMRLSVEAGQHRIADIDVTVTVSVGGSLKEASDTISTAIQEADAALYRAKALGRNRTVFAPVPAPAAVPA